MIKKSKTFFMEFKGAIFNSFISFSILAILISSTLIGCGDKENKTIAKKTVKTTNVAKHDTTEQVSSDNFNLKNSLQDIKHVEKEMREFKQIAREVTTMLLNARKQLKTGKNKS